MIGEELFLYIIWGLFICGMIYFTYKYYMLQIKPWLILAGFYRNTQPKFTILAKLRNNIIRKRVYNIKTESYWVPLDDIYKEFETEMKTNDTRKEK